VRAQWWFLYSAAVLVVGVVLVVATAGRAGIILIAAGLIGLAMNVRQLRR
jgi:hypothetical protein